MPLPLPLRKNGVINATDAELESWERFSEKVAIWSTFLVFVGLVIEGVIAYKHPEYDTFLEQWGSFGSDALDGAL